jgi:hypothetical protein
MADTKLSDLAAVSAPIETTDTIYVVRAGVSNKGTVDDLPVTAAVTTALANKQGLDATLTALAGLNSDAGLLEQTGADAFTKRAIGVGASTSIPTRGDADTRYQASDSDLSDIAGLSPSNDDILQHKAGAWANRTVAQLKTDLALNNVTNHAQTQAAVVPNTVPSAGQILAGNAGGTAYAPVSVSGDATLASTGALTLAGAGLSAKKKTISFVIDGGGSAVTTGAKKAVVRFPWAGTITKATVLADQSGSVVLDVWKDTYANFPPTVADTITASAKPTLSSATKAEDSTLTGWTTSISAGDVLKVNVDSASTLTHVTLILEVTLT